MTSLSTLLCLWCHPTCVNTLGDMTQKEIVFLQLIHFFVSCDATPLLAF